MDWKKEMKKTICQHFAPIKWVVANRKNFFYFCLFLSLGILCVGWIKREDAYIIFAFVPIITAFLVATIIGIWKGEIKILPE